MLIALPLATLAGLSLGLFGGGGSLLLVLILSFALGAPVQAAVATSLLTTGVTSTTALLARRERGSVSVRVGVVFGGAGMLGAFAGGRLTSLLPGPVLLAAFGVVMLCSGVAMLRVEPAAQDADLELSNEQRPRLSRLVALALGIGVVSGSLGAGGGLLILPALLLYGGLRMKRAMATSLLVIALQSFAGFAGHLGRPGLEWAVVMPFTLVATLGSIMGSVLAKRLPQHTLQRGFAVMALLFGLIVILRELPRSH